MSEPHSQPMLTDIERLSDIERRIVASFIRRERVASHHRDQPSTFGERVADRVASFGGSWPFIFLAIGAIAVWIAANLTTARPFDPYPYILLNLVLSCTAALQAPVIMMSQNRQSAHDRLAAQRDYEVNTKAEIEIVALHTKLDEIREQKWIELMKVQEQQLALLARLIEREQEEHHPERKTKT
jgi:uncharacterized membrane protein